MSIDLESVRAAVEEALGAIDGGLVGDVHGVMQNVDGTLSVALDGVFTVTQLGVVFDLLLRNEPGLWMRLWSR